MNEQIELLQSYLTFRLEEEIFAVNVSKVLEILEIPRITRVPHSPSFMRGVINLRGTVMPVIDARKKFGLHEVGDTINSCVVVLNIRIDGQDLTLGAVVDSVQEVMDIQEGDIQPTPTIGSKYKAEFIRGMVKSDEQFIMVLEPDVVFSADEASILQEIVTDDGGKDE